MFEVGGVCLCVEVNVYGGRCVLECLGVFKGRGVLKDGGLCLSVEVYNGGVQVCWRTKVCVCRWRCEHV